MAGMTYVEFVNAVRAEFPSFKIVNKSDSFFMRTLSLLLLGTMAAEVTARATVRAVLAAKRLCVGSLTLPCAADLAPPGAAR